MVRSLFSLAFLLLAVTGWVSDVAAQTRHVSDLVHVADSTVAAAQALPHDLLPAQRATLRRSADQHRIQQEALAAATRRRREEAGTEGRLALLRLPAQRRDQREAKGAQDRYVSALAALHAICDADAQPCLTPADIAYLSRMQESARLLYPPDLPCTGGLAQSPPDSADAMTCRFQAEAALLDRLLASNR